MAAKMSYFLFFLVCLAWVYHPLHAKQQTPVKAIVFDFGGVIAKTDREEVAEYVSKCLNVSKEEAYHSLELLKQHTNKGKQESDFWVAYAKSNGIQLPQNWMKKLDQQRFESLKEMPGMVNIVKDLQEQGYQTALLSNVRESQAQIKRKLGYYELFNPAILSYESGFKKPDPKAYYLLLEKLKMKPNQVLFIDNKRENIATARSIGMDAIEFVNAPQLIAALHARGIEVKQTPNH